MWTPRNNGPGPSWRRYIARVGTALGSAVLAASIGTLSACSDAPTSPAATRPAAPARSTGLLSTTLTDLAGLPTPVPSTMLNGLLWLTPVTQAKASKVIGPGGGTFGIANGIQITVPKGAVSSATAFSVTRLPGPILAYDFQPHGTRFAVPLVVEHPTAGLDLSPLRNPTAKLTAAYVPDLSLLNALSGTVTVSELQPTVVSLDKSAVRFSVWHFSGYVVAWGRDNPDDGQ